jgi:hypothetical protein
VEQIDGLEIKISGGDGQILRGHIPEVFLSAQKAIYQGLFLSQVTVTGKNIRVNLGQVIKGKALRLLEPIFIGGEITLAQADLQSSLSSSLLASGLKDLLVLLLEAKQVQNPAQILKDYEMTWEDVNFHEDKVSLKGSLQNQQGEIFPIHIRTGLSLIDEQILCLNPLHVEATVEHLNFSKGDFQVDLGDLVKIEKLSLDSTQLCCQGKLTVQP